MVQTYETQTTYPTPFAILAPAYFLRYPNPYAPHVLSTDVLDRRIVYRKQEVNNANGKVSDTNESVASASSSSVVRPVLLTSRLILKKGTLPSWAPRGIMRNAESWVLEVSEVDLDGDLTQTQIAAATGAEPPAAIASPTPPPTDFTRMYPPRGLIHHPTDNEEPTRSSTALTSTPTATAGSMGRQMRTWTRNVDHTTVLAVAEGLTFTEMLPKTSAGMTVPPATPPSSVKGKEKEKEMRDLKLNDNGDSTEPRFLPTHCLISAHITSDVSVLWARIEKFGIKRFKAHIDTSRQGLLHTSSLLNHSVSPFSHSLIPPRRSGPLSNLRESLRPPWLDGLPLSPLASLRLRISRGLLKFQEARLRGRERLEAIKEDGWWGYKGRREREEGMATWRESVRERIFRGRQGRWWGTDSASASASTPTSTRREDRGVGQDGPREEDLEAERVV